jgi:phage I-like protein
MNAEQIFNPEQDQQESIEIARQVLEGAIANGEHIDEAVIERAAAAIHAEWLTRTVHREAPDQIELQPYEKLPEEVKEKDRVFVRRALAELQSTDEDG